MGRVRVEEAEKKRRSEGAVLRATIVSTKMNLPKRRWCGVLV